MRLKILVDLRCNVIGCPAKGRRKALFHFLPTHAHIGQSNVAVLVQHHVIKFQITFKKTNKQETNTKERVG